MPTLDAVKRWAGRNLLDTRVFRALMRIFYLCAGRVVWLTAVTGAGGNACLRRGFLPLPVHFYSPVPDVADLERRGVWSARSALAGIDFNAAGQVALLEELGRAFSEECAWGATSARAEDFILQNDCFSYGCAASTHGVIRRFRPRRVIEVGSGLSSRVLSAALEINRAEDGRAADYTIVDPFPGGIVRGGTLRATRLVARRVELLEPEFFDVLAANDVLFIDSSHTSKIGSDVNFLFLEVLPRLAPGVIVHVHDVAFPYEYPREYATNERFRQFWNEQYLLQAYLSGNREWEVMLAMHYLMTDELERFRSAFPRYDPSVGPGISGSFWMRKRTG